MPSCLGVAEDGKEEEEEEEAGRLFMQAGAQQKEAHLEDRARMEERVE